jgi:hypothetical protein
MTGIDGVWLARLIAHLAELVAGEVKAARSIMASLEATILASVHKRDWARSRCGGF